jgi:UDP-N-acetylglucosamine--N-acetylmuramyl-(pentapeptide) pyrophosphoryl-undecaprenol N-acetylglucosamine transferase
VPWAPASISQQPRQIGDLAAGPAGHSPCDMIPGMPASPTVLLISSNGAGMGHLTRLLAYSRRMPPGVHPHVLSLSQAVPVVAAEGVPWEYLPSRGASGMRTSAWRALFTERVAEVLHRVDPDVLVFDGTHPYPGLETALATHPRTRSVWSRRGMWKPGLGRSQLERVGWFDAVLEPGDLAAAADRGLTAPGGVGDAAADRAGVPVHRVRPVTLVDDEHLTSPAQARSALGLPPEGPLALVTLGAGNLNETGDEVGAAVAELSARGIGVCVTAPSIAERAYAGAGVHLVRHYPLTEHVRAFDYAVSAAGYNSFHETLRFGVPTLFVPNRHTSLDDQVARARHAAAAGWALCVDTLTGGLAGAALAELVARGPELAAAARRDDPGNGAADAATHILGLTGAPR